MRTNDTLAGRLRRRPAKPMGSPRVGSNPTGVVLVLPVLPRCGSSMCGHTTSMLWVVMLDVGHRAAHTQCQRHGRYIVWPAITIKSAAYGLLGRARTLRAKYTHSVGANDAAFKLTYIEGAKDTLAERLRRRPAKPMGSPRVGSNPTGVVFAQKALCKSDKDNVNVPSMSLATFTTFHIVMRT